MLNRLSTALALTALTALPGTAAAPAAAKVPIININCLASNLTGTWEGNDGGIYRVREEKQQIQWVGMSGNDGGNSWTHILIGWRENKNPDTIKAGWVDVNGPMGRGDMTLQVRGYGKYLLRTAASGSGFSATQWHKKGC